MLHTNAARVLLATMCLAMAQLAAPSTAGAQGNDAPRVLIVPLSGDAAGELPERWTQALVQASEQRGARVTVAQASLEDTLAIVGCSPEAPSCLEQAAAALEVDRIVFGTVEPQGRGVWTVTITVANQGQPPVERSIQVRAASPAEAEKAFVHAATPVVEEDITAPPPPGSARAPGDGQDGTGSPQDGVPGSEQDSALGAADGGAAASGPSFDFSRVTRSTRIIAGVGGGMMGTGVLFWLLASGKQGEVDSAPDQTAEDLERLVELEDGVRTRAFIGNVLVLTGAATLGVGVVLAIQQGRVAPVTVAPMAGPDTMGLVLTVEWSP